MDEVKLVKAYDAMMEAVELVELQAYLLSVSDEDALRCERTEEAR